MPRPLLFCLKSGRSVCYSVPDNSNGRYGLLSSDLWIDTGFHCGEGLEVLVDDEWVQTRMEMNLAREWYLVGTSYCGDLEYVQARIPG